MLKILILILLPLIIFSQNVWEEVYRFEPIRTMTDIGIIDTLKVYVGTSGGDVLYSSDKGETWKFISHEKTNYSCVGLSVPDSNNIFLVYLREHIRKSTNGGKDYQSIVLPNPWYGRNFNIIMLNSDIGIIKNSYTPFTKNGWESLDSIGFGENIYSPSLIHFKNDSIIYILYTDLYDWENFNIDSLSPEKYDRNYFGIFNLNSKELKPLIKLIPDNNSHYQFDDIFIRNDTIILIGHHSSTNAPSSVNTIIKSVDGGKTWKPLLDVLFRFYLNGKFYSQMLGLRNISFKNDSVGIVTGQFGKVLYTYDAGSSWYLDINEIDRHESVFHINYESGDAILTVGNTTILKLREDNLAPQPQDTFYISGYIFEGDKPQKHIPIALDNRITITDENGFYEFTRVRGRAFELKPLNKHYNYTPYIYEPDSLNITITKDTVINFQAIDNRVFHNMSGNVYSDLEVLADIPVVSYNGFQLYAGRAFTTELPTKN